MARGIDDKPLSDVAYDVHNVLYARYADDVMRWIAVTHCGTMHGQLLARGLPTSVAGDAVLEVARQWVAGAEHTRIAAALPDPEILALTERQHQGRQLVERMRPDIGGIYDFGAQYGERRERRMPIERAQYEVGAWVAQWPQYTNGVNPWPPPAVPPADLSRLLVEPNRRYFRNDSGRFQWREISLFSCLARVLRGEGESHVRPLLREARAMGFTITRQFGTLWGDYWRDFLQGPNLPGFWDGLHWLANAHLEEGLYMRFCYLAALDPFGGRWDESRRDIFQGAVRDRAVAYLLDAARELAQYPHIVGELINEPDHTGFRDSWHLFPGIARQMKAVAPGQLLCAGEDNRGRGVVAPFDYADAHLPRDMAVHGWHWIKRCGEHPVVDQDVMPFVAGENVNMGEARRDGRTGDVERQPANCFGAAAVSRARRMGGICFHWDGGLWTTPMRPETVACAQAWHAGLDAFPMLTDGMWRGHWSREQGNYWDQRPYPGSDDLGLVKQHVERGEGPWRVFGCGGHSVTFPYAHGYDPARHLESPATRVGGNDAGRFSVSVYGRL